MRKLEPRLEDLPLNIDLWDGAQYIPIPRRWSYTEIEAFQAQKARAIRARKLKDDFYGTHPGWNYMTTTCLECGKTTVEIYANKLMCTKAQEEYNKLLYADPYTTTGTKPTGLANASGTPKSNTT